MIFVNYAFLSRGRSAGVQLFFHSSLFIEESTIFWGVKNTSMSDYQHRGWKKDIDAEYLKNLFFLFGDLVAFISDA